MFDPAFSPQNEQSTLHEIRTPSAAAERPAGKLSGAAAAFRTVSQFVRSRLDAERARVLYMQPGRGSIYVMCTPTAAALLKFALPNTVRSITPIPHESLDAADGRGAESGRALRLKFPRAK